MGLSGEDELHRAVRVGEDFSDQRHIPHDQVGPLVGGETPGESDRERLGVEGLAQLFDHGVGQAAPLRLRRQPRAGIDDQPVLQRLVRFPQFARGHLLEPGPDLRLAGTQVPVDRQHAVVKHAHLRGQPRRHVHAVGDVADGNFLFAPPRPEARPTSDG